MRDSGHLRGWTIKDSSDLYNVDLWSSRFFSINEAGHVMVRPRRDDGPGIDLKGLVEDMRMITVNKLLKSCATPPASNPIASIFCD